MSIDLDEDNYILDEEIRLKRSKSISSTGKENIVPKTRFVGLPAPEYLVLQPLLCRWTKEEHELFLEGLQLYGREWKKIAHMIGTRTIIQVRTHAQKFFQKMKNTNNSFDISTFVNNNSRISSSDLSSTDMISSHDQPHLSRNKSYSVSVPYVHPMRTINEFPSSNTNNSSTPTATAGSSSERPFMTLTRHQSMPTLNTSMSIDTTSKVTNNGSTNNNTGTNMDLPPIPTGNLNSFSKNEYDTYNNSKKKSKDSNFFNNSSISSSVPANQSNSGLPSFFQMSPSNQFVNSMPASDSYYNSMENNLFSNSFNSGPSWDREESNASILDSFPYFRDEGVSVMSNFNSFANDTNVQPANSNSLLNTPTNQKSSSSKHFGMRNSISLPISNSLYQSSNGNSVAPNPVPSPVNANNSNINSNSNNLSPAPTINEFNTPNSFMNPSYMNNFISESSILMDEQFAANSRDNDDLMMQTCGFSSNMNEFDDNDMSQFF